MARRFGSATWRVSHHAKPQTSTNRPRLRATATKLTIQTFFSVTLSRNKFSHRPDATRARGRFSSDDTATTAAAKSRFHIVASPRQADRRRTERGPASRRASYPRTTTMYRLLQLGHFPGGILR